MSRHRPDHDYLISPGQLTRAMRLRAAGAGIVGQVNCAVPARRDDAMLTDVTLSLRAALDDMTDRRFGALDPVIRIQSLQRTQHRRRDLLDPHAKDETTTTITGCAIVEIADDRSEPWDFTIDESGTHVQADGLQQWIETIVARADNDPAAVDPPAADTA